MKPTIFFLITAVALNVSLAAKDFNVLNFGAKGDGVTVDTGNAQMAWGVSPVNSWYKNEHGVVTNNWPAFTVSYWKRMREHRPHEFVRFVPRFATVS